MIREQVALALTIDCTQCAEPRASMCRTSLGYKKNIPHWRRLWKAEEKDA